MLYWDHYFNQLSTRSSHSIQLSQNYFECIVYKCFSSPLLILATTYYHLIKTHIILFLSIHWTLVALPTVFVSSVSFFC